MSLSGVHRVHLVEGNETVHGIVTDVLSERDIDVVPVVPRPGHEPETAFDLLIVDVDGRSEAPDKVVEVYRAAERPVLFCGVGTSRGAYSDQNWLSRPFSPEELYNDVARLLDIEEGDSESSEAKQLGEETTDLEEVSEDFEASDTDVDAFEPEDTKPSAANVSGDSEVFEIDEADEVVLEVNELAEDLPHSGRRVGEVAVRRLDEVEYNEDRASTPDPATFEKSPSNPTVPDMPKYREATGQSDDAEGTSEPAASDTRTEAPGSHVGPAPESTPVPRGASEVSSGGLEGRLAPQFSRELETLSWTLAGAWDKVGLTARRADRAERISRTLHALFEHDLEAAESTLDRIPSSRGFSGDLRTLGPSQLLEMIRRQGLRGRLELSGPGMEVVLYLAAGRLDDIEELGGDDDMLLLDALRDIDALDDGSVRRLRDSVAGGLGAPLEVKVRTERLVSRDELRQARRLRAERIFEQVLGMSEGTFAFMEVTPEDGHTWPVHPLELSLDELVVEKIRASFHGEAEAVTDGDEASSDRDEETDVLSSNS